jgi:hypothetical protein
MAAPQSPPFEVVILILSAVEWGRIPLLVFVLLPAAGHSWSVLLELPQKNPQKNFQKVANS